jgi:hypothetical protein
VLSWFAILVARIHDCKAMPPGLRDVSCTVEATTPSASIITGADALQYDEQPTPMPLIAGKTPLCPVYAGCLPNAPQISFFFLTDRCNTQLSVMQNSAMVATWHCG